MDLIFATKNKHKLAEIREIMEGFNVLSLEDIGADIDVVEDRDSFEGNALKKAEEICAATGRPVLSDDSGLVIDYLGGAPGVYSARYMGENTPYAEKNARILALLEGVPEGKRSARFVCAIVAAFPGENGVTSFCETGVIEGRIHTETAGENGFGYDPLFYVPEYGMTTAEMPERLKNEISHRGKALRLMKKRLGARHEE